MWSKNPSRVVLSAKRGVCKTWWRKQKRKWFTPLFTWTPEEEEEEEKDEEPDWVCVPCTVRPFICRVWQRSPWWHISIQDTLALTIFSTCLEGGVISKADKWESWVGKATFLALPEPGSQPELPSKVHALPQCFGRPSFPSHPHVALALRWFGSCQPS